MSIQMHVNVGRKARIRGWLNSVPSQAWRSRVLGGPPSFPWPTKVEAHVTASNSQRCYWANIAIVNGPRAMRVWEERFVSDSEAMQAADVELERFFQKFDAAVRLGWRLE